MEPSETKAWYIVVGVAILLSLALFLAGCAFDKLSIERGLLDPSGTKIPAKLPVP